MGLCRPVEQPSSYLWAFWFLAKGLINMFWVTGCSQVGWHPQQWVLPASLSSILLGYLLVSYRQRDQQGL